MKTFKLDLNGDVVIADNKIDMVSGIEITIQTLKQVIGTNLGEWFGNGEEGVDLDVILTKNPNYDLVQNTIETAVQYVADMLGIELEADDFQYNVVGRTLDISFELTQTTEEATDTAQVDVTL